MFYKISLYLIKMDIFFITILFCFFLWGLNKYFRFSLIENLRNSPQTFHKKSVSRLGGIAIFMSLFITSYFLSGNNEEYRILRLALASTLPIFLVGILDDLKIQISPITRILFMIPTPVIFFYFLDVRIESVGIDFIDGFLKIEIIGLLFLIFSLIGIINAFNIVDGFNGLLLTYCLSVLLTLILAYESSSGIDWLTYIVAIFFAIFGVFLFNFPFGKLFLGDAGAYLLGALIPISLIEYTFDNGFSPWFVLAVLIYPVTEVFTSIVRKVFFRKMSAMQPDGLHFHMLVYKKISKKVGFRRVRLRHFVVTLFIFSINFPFLLAANLYKSDSIFLIFLSCSYLLFYIMIYFLMIPKYAFGKK